MNDNLLIIRTLTDRFLDGETTLEEEQELYDFFAATNDKAERNSQDDLPEDLRPIQEMFRDFAALQAVAPTRSEEESHATIQRLTPRRSRWWIAAAAVAVLVIMGGAALYHFQHEDECVAYIYGQRVTDRDVVLGEMQKTMAVLTTDGSDVVEEQLKAMFGN